jgi:diguanylate cyclase (GGDEF)-like protein
MSRSLVQGRVGFASTAARADCRIQPRRAAARREAVRMQSLPLVARVYVLAVVAAGTAVAVLAFRDLRIAQTGPFAALLLVAVLASVFKIQVPMPASLAAQPLTMSLAFAANFASLLLLDGPSATLVAVVAAWSQTTFNTFRARNPWHRTIFNMAALALTMAATEAVLVGVAGHGPPFQLRGSALALGLAAATYYVANSGLVAGAVAAASGQSFLPLWMRHLLSGWIGHVFGAAAAALAVAMVGRSGYWIAPLVALSIGLGYRAYRAYMHRMDQQQLAVQRLSDLHLATVEALALAIDAADQGSRTHLRRLQRYATLLARASGLGDDDVQAVATAAMLHDIGMLAVPQHILAKREGLTDDERRKLWLHPQVGADIIHAVPFPAPVAPLILGHHERWDGGGYPAGLGGDEIPIGARIIALVDRFDALLREPGTTPEAALARLRDDAGRALDPALVEKFQRLKADVLAIEADLAPGAPASEIDVRELPERTASPNAVAHIAHAQREVYGLYDLSQALGATLTVTDAMQQLRQRLGGLVPFSTCALFLQDTETGRTTCRWMGGREATDAATSIANEFVEGPVAWVLEHGRSLVTALPASAPVRRADGLPARAPGVVEVLICPLRVDDCTYGALAAYHEKRGTFADDQRRIFERVAEIVSSAIQNALRYERTHEAALTDRLTSLANSWGLVAGAEQALARAAHEQEPLAVLMLDVDRFKAVNDTHGHEAGDRALKVVARVLSQAVRPNDLCARYGGDEFVVLLANCDIHQADRRAAELKRQVAALRFEASPGEAMPLRISVGASVYPTDGSAFEALLAVADRRMYHDKTMTRHGTSRWAELVDASARETARTILRD